MKKSRGEISNKIISALEREPLPIQQISKKVESNWTTVNEVLEELKKEGKVREIVSTEKIRLFRLTRDDAYLDIPITKDEKQLFYFLFDNARKQFTEQGKKSPTKIDIQKSVVKVIDHFNLQVPTVWYLFGKMTLLKYEPEKNYTTEFKPENYAEILNFMKKVVIEIIKMRYAKKVIKDQYYSYNQELYQKKEKIYDLILYQNLNKKKQELKELFSEFFIVCPTNEDSTEINLIIHDFILLVGKMAFLDLEKYKKEILETFDAVWKMLSIYLFFESLTKLPKFKNREEIKTLYFEDSINNKMSTARDFISNLNSIYLNNLSEIKEPPKLPDTPEARLLREMFFEMAMEREGG